MAAWKTDEHLIDHYDDHRHEFPGISLEAYDVSAQETLVVGEFFPYRDRITSLRRTGCYDRETARITVLDTDGRILSHFRCGEDYVAGLPGCTYRGEYGRDHHGSFEDRSADDAQASTRPLAEVYRRLVGIHAAIAERTNNDPEVRPWAVREIMDVLHYIESVEETEQHADATTPT